MTVRPALERSSATTLWISAHCSLWAPGGVSQRICQSPCTERTAPCAWAGALAATRLAASKPAASRPNRRRRVVGCVGNPIQVIPEAYLELLILAHATEPAMTAP